MAEITDWEEYARGLWRPSVPLPYLGLFHVACHCGRRFRGLSAYDYLRGGRVRERYESHYRAVHVEGQYDHNFEPEPGDSFCRHCGDNRLHHPEQAP